MGLTVAHTAEGAPTDSGCLSFLCFVMVLGVLVDTSDRFCWAS